MTDVQARASEPALVPAATKGVAPEITGRLDSPAGSDQGSFGRALAAARGARGMSKADVAAQLRLHVRQVEALEAEDMAALPEAPFVRGYVRNYARLVDLAAEPLLALLNARLKPTDPLHSNLAAGAVSPLQRTPREPISGRFVLGGVVVLLVVLAVLGWWTMRGESGPPPAPMPAAAPAPAPVAEAAAVPPQAAPEAAPASEAAPAATAETDLAPTALRLTFRDRSWVEVRQADGTVLVSQNNAAGTTRVVEGEPPYLLVIGNASKVTLEYRGRQVDLAPSISRDDVARLRLE